MVLPDAEQGGDVNAAWPQGGTSCCSFSHHPEHEGEQQTSGEHIMPAEELPWLSLCQVLLPGWGDAQGKGVLSNLG